MQSGNWRVARDSVWELEGCTSSSQRTGGGTEPVPAQIPLERVPERTGTRITVGSLNKPYQ